MNGKGKSIDNIAIKRFFLTFKYEESYIKVYLFGGNVYKEAAK